ncbi:MAG: cyclic nucleotide-binding domain-containing protein [Bacteroidota bacterium]
MEALQFWAYDELISKSDVTIVEKSELWNSILVNTKVLSLKKGETLIKKKERDASVYVIINGAFECNLMMDDNKGKLVWFFLDTLFDAATALDTFFKGVQTKYEITAIEDATVIKFEKSFLEKLCKEHKIFNDFYIHQILNSFFYYFEIRNNMLALSSFEFLMYLQKNYPFIVERVSSHKLANFMGITPEWLSKLKRRRVGELTNTTSKT